MQEVRFLFRELIIKNIYLTFKQHVILLNQPLKIQATMSILNPSRP